MHKVVTLLSLALITISCFEKKENSSINPVIWEKRSVTTPLSVTLIQGATYLSIYSQIYSQTEHITHDLTTTVSMRNTNEQDTLYIESAKYFDTKGKLIRTYFDKPIYLQPLETVEIVIDQQDQAGGTGANFIFHWRASSKMSEPLFEGIMISTYGQQGLSFTTQGKRIK